MQHKEKIPTGLLIIGVFKVVLALLLLAAGIGFFHLLNHDIQKIVQDFIKDQHINRENMMVAKGLALLTGASRRQLFTIDAVTFFYATFYMIEGIGLLLRKHWAEYLVVIATGLLIPFEIYEVVGEFSLMKTSILVINIAIVVYLIYRLRKDKEEGIE